MKSRLIILLVFLLANFTLAQQSINYKAIIKDNLGNVLSNQSVTVQFAILQGAGATMVYQEDHTVNTDTNGLVILNIGDGNILNGEYNMIDWGSDDHFLNVQIDSGSGLVDLGTTQFMAVPYALYAETSGSGSTAAGLEALDEGNGVGWRLIGRDPNNYGNVGLNATDLSFSNTVSEQHGSLGFSSFAAGYQTSATGNYTSAIGYQTVASGPSSIAMGLESVASQSVSLATGYQTIASGQFSTAMGSQSTASGFGSFAIGVENEASGDNSISLGYNTIASALFSTAIGYGSTALGDSSMAFGHYTIADDPSSIVVGSYNDNTVSDTTVFQVGNGTISMRQNALNIDFDGVVTAPSFDISEITDPKALITKEYLEANTENSSGLEALDEGNGGGWRLIGRDPNNYDDIGEHSVDLSYSNEVSTTRGASGYAALSSGYGTIASGTYATAMGNITTASGFSTTSLGFETIADDQFSTVVGRLNDHTTSSNMLFQVGNGNSAGRSNAFNVNFDGVITAPSFDISEITDPKALITKEYFEANGGTATGLEAINEGNGIGWRLIGRDSNNYDNIGLNALDLSFGANGNVGGHGASGDYSTAIGFWNTASGTGSTSIGKQSIATGNYSTSIGDTNFATGYSSLAVGYNNEASGYCSVSLNRQTEASGYASCAFGDNTTASGSYSTAMGYFSLASASYSTSIGWNCEAIQNYALAMGENTTSSGISSVALGAETIASGNGAFTAGDSNTAAGNSSVALGYQTNVTHDYSFAMGNNTQVSSFAASALGYNLINDDSYSMVVGQNNDNTITANSLFMVGNGVNTVNRSNAFTVFQNGNATLAGTLTQSSDRRLKQDITDLDYGLNEVLQLKPVSYHWKKYPDQPKSLGLIAQEVQTIIKEIVHESEDKDKTLSVSYMELIPVLIKAIQEQQVIIDRQSQTIQNQEQASAEQTQVLQALLKRVEALEKQSVSTSQVELVKN